MSNASIILSIVVGLGLLGGVGYGIKAFLEKKVIESQASGNQATATAVIVAAARELVDPLREELAKERKEHAEVIEMERKKVADLRRDLAGASKEAEDLRVELGRALEAMQQMRIEMARLNEEAEAHRNEAVKYREEAEAYLVRIKELEANKVNP